ncbi:hypothetical protein A2U01_0026505, partial [Trifolium medium]|nr:hypothetical protein [Trifolium medium]
RNRTRNNVANVALMDSNPFERGDDEFACIRCSLQGAILAMRNGFYLNAIPALNHYEGIENEKMSKPESPSCTFSLHHSTSQGHCLLPGPASMERHLEPSENEDFANSW